MGQAIQIKHFHKYPRTNTDNRILRPKRSIVLDLPHNSEANSQRITILVPKDMLWGWGNLVKFLLSRSISSIHNKELSMSVTTITEFIGFFFIQVSNGMEHQIHSIQPLHVRVKPYILLPNYVFQTNLNINSEQPVTKYANLTYLNTYTINRIFCRKRYIGLPHYSSSQKVSMFNCQCRS